MDLEGAGWSTPERQEGLPGSIPIVKEPPTSVKRIVEGPEVRSQ